MLPHNVIIAADFERQNRNRIQQEAENSRLLRRSGFKESAAQVFPAWKPVFRKLRLIQLHMNPAKWAVINLLI